MQYIPVFSFCVEVRASFSAVIVAVAHSPASIELRELSDELQHSCLLAWCSGVYSLPSRVLTSDITHSYAVSVVPFAMCARFCESAAFFYGSIALDNVMIAAGSKTSLLVAHSHLLYSPVVSWWCVSAVYYDFVDVSHGSWFKERERAFAPSPRSMNWLYYVATALGECAEDSRH